MSQSIESALDAAILRYQERNPKSLALHERAIKSLPGGNTRTLLHAKPFPIYLSHGVNHNVYDEDGHQYCDLTGEMSAGLYGHSNQILLATLAETSRQIGMNLGGTTEAEARYAEALCARFRLERVRFCNSGTEANLHALAAARRITGRRKVVVFEGGYHGAVLSFGYGVAPNNVDIEDWVIGTYNDVEGVSEVVAKAQPAAVLVEGMQGAAGGIVGSEAFLKAVESAAKKSGAIFIIDEIQTSRFGSNGMAQMYGLNPDMVTLGKYLGGGLAFGAFGGRAEVLSVFDPRKAGSIPHSGTFNQNTLGMACGFKGLSTIYTSEKADAFTKKGDAFLERLNEVTKDSKCSFIGKSTIMTPHFRNNAGELKCIRDLAEASEDLKALFWMFLLENGFWVSNRCSICLMLDTPDEDLERFVQTVQEFLDKYHDLLYQTVS